MSSRRLILIAAMLLGFSIAPCGGGAQDIRKVPRVAVLSWQGAATTDQLMAAFRQGLRELGHVEGRSIALEYHWAEGRNDRAAELAAELVRRQVDVIVAWSTPAAHAAKAATRTIPIVMLVADPLATGLVASLARPGGNVTGISSISPELAGKRLEMLREVIPNLGKVAFLGSAKDPNAATFVGETRSAAERIGVQLQTLLVDGPADFEAAFMAMTREGAAAVIVQPIFSDHPAAIAALATRHRLPLIADYRPFVEAGGLLSYGTNRPDMYRRSAAYVDKILRGAKPGDLPIEQPNTFELAVNLKTAAALGLTIPPSILLRADEVIE